MADREVTRRAGAIAAGQGAVKASQLVIAIALVRLLSPQDWSRAAIVLSIYLAAVTIGTLNLQHSLLFFMPRVGPGRHRRLIYQTAGIMAAAGITIAVLLVCLTPTLSGSRLELGQTVPMIALAIAIEIPCACAQPALIAIDRAGGAAWWDLLNTAIFLAATVGPAALGFGVTAVVTGIVAAAVCRALLFAIMLSSQFERSHTTLPTGMLRDQLRYGLPLGLTIATAVLNRSVDKWFVAAFDASNTGIYAVAAQEIPLLAVLPYAGGAAIVTSIVAAFLDGDTDRARQFWIRQTATMSSLVVPLSAGLILIAPELITLVFTSSFSPGVLPFQLFTAITLHRVAEYGLVLRAADRTRDLLMSALVLLCANVVLAGIGAAIWGMVGASLGTLLANACAWWFILGRLADAFGSTRRHSFAWRSWFVAIGVSTVAVAIASAASHRVATTSVAALVVKIGIFLPAVALGIAAANRSRADGSVRADEPSFDVVTSGTPI